MTFDEPHLRARSLWWDTLPGRIAPRPALAGDVDCDVAIVGAGMTGLWTAYCLLDADPTLRVRVLERQVAGFGASGRNGGWISAGIAGVHGEWARACGDDAVRRAERATWEAVDWIGARVAAERIDCGFAKGGILSVARNEAQEQRIRDHVDHDRRWGWGEEDVMVLSRAQVQERVAIPDVRLGSFTPHGARVNPARLARGLADAVERKGGVIHEQTAARFLEPGRVVTDHGVVRAAHVIRATEAFTVQFANQSRAYLPLYSLMIATEPLPKAVWDELGWSGLETVSDAHHLFFYAQRTTDDRIAIGGRGAPYSLGSPIDEQFERNDAVRQRLTNTVFAAFPAARGAQITHHWGGALGVPRDWSMSVTHDPATGLGFAGGYSGHGVAAASLSGRTLADLILRRDSDLVSMPWVNHPVRPWEPEPLRWIASRAIVQIMGQSDRVEDAGRAGTARRMRIIRPFLGH
ncbi:MAG: NAD(P)/FAD-dependent oxidoreductase [Gaiellales bacterium]